MTDDGVIAGVTVNGVAAAVSGGQFTAQVDLTEGPDTLEVRAVDSTGKEKVAVVTVTLDTQRPNLILDTPASGQLTNQEAIRVAGLAEDSNGIERVEVNGAPVPVSGGRFESEMALAEGLNRLAIRVVPPYQVNHVTVIQKYIYWCPCLNLPEGQAKTLPGGGPFVIFRTVDHEGPWKVCISKAGVGPSCQELPPQ